MQDFYGPYYRVVLKIALLQYYYVLDCEFDVKTPEREIPELPVTCVTQCQISLVPVRLCANGPPLRVPVRQWCPFNACTSRCILPHGQSAVMRTISERCGGLSSRSPGGMRLSDLSCTDLYASELNLTCSSGQLTVEALVGGGLVSCNLTGADLECIPKRKPH